MFLTSKRKTSVPSLLEENFDSLFDWKAPSLMSIFRSKTYNLKQDSDSYTIEVVAPKVKKEDITIEVERGNIHIATKTGGSERTLSSFSYEFRLSADVDVDKVEAKLDSGVLTVTLPKTEYAKRQVIEVR